MAKKTLEDLLVVVGIPARNGLPGLDRLVYNTECAFAPDTGLTLIMTVVQDNPRAKPHSRLVTYQNGDWSLIKDIKGPTFNTGCMVVLADQSVLIMSDDGDVYRWDGRRLQKEPDIPGGQDAYMTALCCIDGVAYAVGTERNVWRRDSSGHWTSLHGPMHFEGMEDMSNLEMGFLTIAGTAANDIYVSGYGADTWHYNGETWQQINLPWQEASLIKGVKNMSAPSINTAICAPDGYVYLGGSMSTVFRGRGLDWELVDLIGPKNSGLNIGNMTWFNDRIYFAGHESGSLIYVLEEGGVYRLPDDGPPDHAASLFATKDRLYACTSFGVLSFDGTNWEAL